MKCVFAAVLAFACATAAEASPIALGGTLTIDGLIGGGVSVSYHTPLNPITSPITTALVGATPVSNVVGLGTLPASFEAYCADLTADLFDVLAAGSTFHANTAPLSDWPGSGPDTPFPPANGTPQPNAGGQASWLYDQFWSHAASIGGDGRAALQIAIWNALYDADFSVSNSSGSFYVTSNSPTVVTLANVYLSQLQATIMIGSPLPDDTWIQVLDSSCNAETGTCLGTQDLMGPASTASAIPEPGTVLLLGSGLASLVTRSLRRRAHCHNEPLHHGGH